MVGLMRWLCCLDALCFRRSGAGALAKQIWRDQAQEIKAMGQWRKAWYYESHVYHVAFETDGDPNSMESLDSMRLLPSRRFR